MHVLLNLLLLAGEAGLEVFIVESLAVAGSCRGLRPGTAMVWMAESSARSIGERTMSLDTIAENEGATRLCERLGWRTTSRRQGLLAWLTPSSDEVPRMEQPLARA